MVDQAVQVNCGPLYLVEEREQFQKKLSLRHPEGTAITAKSVQEKDDVIYGRQKNWSRDWILNDSCSHTRAPSEMKDSYGYKIFEKEKKGPRREMMEKFFWKEMLQDAVEELAKPKPVEEYCSEYDSNYDVDGFELKDWTKADNKDLHLRYPLYGTGSIAITYYSEANKTSNDKRVLKKFGKYTNFSKPIGEHLDGQWQGQK